MLVYNSVICDMKCSTAVALQHSTAAVKILCKVGDDHARRNPGVSIVRPLLYLQEIETTSSSSPANQKHMAT